MNASQTVALHGLLQSIYDGDQNAVARAGITTDNARRLMNLQAPELLALVQANTAFIQFKIDNAVLNLLLQEIDRSRSRQQTAHALIESDAPLEMIRHFYPYIQRRKAAPAHRVKSWNWQYPRPGFIRSKIRTTPHQMIISMCIKQARLRSDRSGRCINHSITEDQNDGEDHFDKEQRGVSPLHRQLA
jgi:hypothetical protein